MSRVKNYAKSKAKNYAKKKVKNLLLKTAPYWIPIVAILFIVLLITATLQSFLEDGAIADTLSKEDNQKLIQYSIDKAREVNGNLLDYNSTDDNLSLDSAYINSYYKYIQLNENEKQTLESVKDKILTIAEKMKPRFLYVKSERKTVTTKVKYYSMPRTYSWTVYKSVYNEQTGQYENVPEKKSQTVTVSWTEEEEITEVQPIWIIVSADTIKQAYTFNYDINQYTTNYSNNNPTGTIKNKSENLNLDFDPQEFINSKNCYTAQELNIKTKYEIKTNFNNKPTEDEMKSTTNSKIVNISPKTESPPSIAPANSSYSDGEKTLTKEEITKVNETIPELTATNPIGNEFQRLEDIIKTDNPNEDIKLAKAMIINSAENYISGQKEANWVFSEINDYMNIAGYTNTSYIPAQFLTMFQEAEKIYGIPYWFLGAIAYRESSFNPAARTSNSDGVAVGLMQVQQKYWDSRVNAFKNKFPNVDIVGDINNPRDQILIGTWTIYNCIIAMTDKEPKDIGWQSDTWKEEVIPALAGYWMSINGAKKYDEPNNFEKTRTEYAPSLLAMAEQYKTTGAMLANSNIIKPVMGDMNITSPFGMRKHPITGVLKMHTGIDIATTSGQPVYAVKDATVEFAGWQNGYGRLIILKSGEYEFYYAHLLDINVQVGDQVQKGQMIGSSDSSGASTGNHLHFEIRINGTPVDPIIELSNINHN